MQRTILFCTYFVLTLSSLKATNTPLPTPQDIQLSQGEISVNNDTVVEYLMPGSPSETIEIAAELIEKCFRERGFDSKSSRAELNEPARSGSVQIILASYEEWVQQGQPHQGDLLDPLDKELLTRGASTGQEYILWTEPATARIYLIGAADQGVLNAAATLRQLLKTENGQVRISGVQVRDYPDFEYRMAADWLMNVEIDRWSYDWADGLPAYLQRMKQKLDQYVLYKINMVLAHGFGWGTDLFPGFADMMRELNQYARSRGIRLVTGGYGASYGMTYQSGPLYEEAPYLGEAFLNRDSYPDGEVYECMGFHYQREGGMNPRLTGSCRGNDELNRLKAEELREYVKRTEPGGLYIHYEDFGGFSGTQETWLQRCDRYCRKRWPNDDLVAPDGGAGALAHGYRQLIDAIQSVKNPETGYDAAKDCTIILVSPVYHTSATSETDWENVLALWENIATQLPLSPQVQVCFREIYPLKDTGRRFIDEFNRRMDKIDRPYKVFMFYAGGANYFYNDYPVVSSPAYNRSFLGAGSIYNGNSGFNQEPLQLIQAEYSWNVRSTGFYRDPKSYESAAQIRHAFQNNDVWPDAIYGENGLLERATIELYGEEAAESMMKFHMLYDLASEPETPPGMWNKLYPMAVLWRNLALDRRTWESEITDKRVLTFMEEHGLSKSLLHHHLASRWKKWSRITNRGAQHVEQALLRVTPEAPVRQDLEHLFNVLEVGGHFSDLIVDLHHFLKLKDGDTKESQKEIVLKRTSNLRAFIMARFGTDTLDPSGGEIGAWLRTLQKIRDIVSNS